MDVIVFAPPHTNGCGALSAESASGLLYRDTAASADVFGPRAGEKIAKHKICSERVRKHGKNPNKQNNIITCHYYCLMGRIRGRRSLCVLTVLNGCAPRRSHPQNLSKCSMLVFSAGLVEWCLSCSTVVCIFVLC